MRGFQKVRRESNQERRKCNEFNIMQTELDVRKGAQITTIKRKERGKREGGVR